MNPWATIPFVSLFVSAMLTVYVFGYNRTQTVNRAYLMVSFVVTLWIFGDFLLWIPVPDSWAIAVLKAESLAWLTLGFWFTRFTYIFIRRAKDKFYYLILTASIVLILPTLLGNLVISGFVHEYWGIRIVGGPLYGPVTVVAIAFPFVFSLYLIDCKISRLNGKGVSHPVGDNNQCDFCATDPELCDGNNIAPLVRNPGDGADHTESADLQSVYVCGDHALQISFNRCRGCGQ